jgi:endoglucanase
MKELIQKLVETNSPSGYESHIRDLIRLEVEPLADEVRVDALGNLIVRKRAGSPQGVRLMLTAHMDEIGLMVTHVDENGFARFIPLGGVQARYCPGGRVRFLNGASGVIGLERSDEAVKTPAFEQMFIDLGADNRQNCPVQVGDVAAFDRPFTDLGDRLVSKALDDRIGVAVMIEALRRLATSNPASLHEVYFVFSVQEEVGVRGATAAAFGLDPEVGLAVDVTDTGDTPKSRPMSVSLGKGPAIKVRDAGMLADPRVVDWMARTAEAARLPYQMEILERGSTDARAIQLSRAGVPTGCLSIPCRYIHAPSEMVATQDVLQAVSLLVELLSHPIELK